MAGGSRGRWCAGAAVSRVAELPRVGVESDLLDFGRSDKGDLAIGLLAFVEVVVARDDGGLGVALGATTEA